MKLPQDKLDAFRAAKDKYEDSKGAVAHAALEKKVVLSKEEYHTNNFLEAFEAFKTVQTDLIKEYGEGVQIDLKSGKLTIPKENA